jgi:hypothetical protein
MTATGRSPRDFPLSLRQTPASSFGDESSNPSHKTISLIYTINRVRGIRSTLIARREFSMLRPLQMPRETGTSYEQERSPFLRRSKCARFFVLFDALHG